MSFTIDRYKENELSLVRLQDTATNTIVTVLPAYGALLHSFDVLLDDEHFNIIDNYRDKEDVDRSLAISYKSSKLSPFVCRIAAGKYRMDDKTYEFKNKFPDGTAIHGLLYNKAFTIMDQFTDDNKASVTLRYHYKKEDPGYPFSYVCDVRYTLQASKVLQVETTVLNLEDLPIPIADGWHPYFRLGGRIDDCELQFNSDIMLEFNDQLIPTGKAIHDPSFKTSAPINSRFLDNCFPLQVVEGTPCCIFQNPQQHLALLIYTNAGYPYLQLYTPDHRQSIAIENLSAAPDCFNNGMGVIMLPARRSETFTVWYQVRTD